MPTTRTSVVATTRTRRRLARGWAGARRSCRRTAPRITRPTATTSRAVRAPAAASAISPTSTPKRAHHEPGSPLGGAVARPAPTPNVSARSTALTGSGRCGTSHAATRAMPAPSPARVGPGAERRDNAADSTVAARQQKSRIGASVRPSWATCEDQRDAGHRAGRGDDGGGDRDRPSALAQQGAIGQGDAQTPTVVVRNGRKRREDRDRCRAGSSASGRDARPLPGRRGVGDHAHEVSLAQRPAVVRHGQQLCPRLVRGRPDLGPWPVAPADAGPRPRPGIRVSLRVPAVGDRRARCDRCSAIGR